MNLNLDKLRKLAKKHKVIIYDSKNKKYFPKKKLVGRLFKNKKTSKLLDKKKSRFYGYNKGQLKTITKRAKLKQKRNKKDLIDVLLERDDKLVNKMRRNYKTALKTKRKIPKIEGALKSIMNIRRKGYYKSIDTIYLNRLKSHVGKIIRDDVAKHAYVVELELDNDPEEQNRNFFTLSSKQLRNVFNKLERGLKHVEEQIYVSDGIESFMVKNVTNLWVKKLPRKKIVDSDGKYFGRINISPFDLTRYQIINDENQLDILEDHCLIYSLRLAGISENILNKVKLMIKNNYFKKTDFKKLSGVIDRKIILHVYKCNRTKIEKINYGNNNKIIRLCLYDSHYFIYDDNVEITKYSARNWKEIQDSYCKKLNQVTKKLESSKCGYRHSSKKYNLNSLSIIKTLDNSNSFVNSDIFKNVHQISKKFNENNYEETLDNIDVIYVFNNKQPSEDKPTIIFADIESITETEKHQAFKICLSALEDKTIKTPITDVDNQKDLLFHFMNYIHKTYNNNKYIIYFHNLKYDLSFFLRYFYIKNCCKKDGKVYSCIILYRKKEYEFRDSYKLIPMPLRKFGETFGMNVHKEVIPYGAYNKKTIQQKRIKYKYAKKILRQESSSKSEYKDKSVAFRENLEITDSRNGKYIDHMHYMDYYLRKDVEVLKKGMIEFSKLIKDVTGLNVYEYLTLSTLVINYSMNDNVFEGVAQLGGEIRNYIQKACYGGRTCTAYNQKHKIIGKISDFDAVSLYPSAIVRVCKDLGGFPKGAPKLAQDLSMNFFNKQDYYVVSIKINNINKNLPIPFIGVRRDDGCIDYTNEPPDHIIVVDKITLEDYIKFHKIDFEIVKGVYWNDGFNNKFGEVTQHLFNERLKYKKQHNTPMSTILKLMLNSMYGKTLMKASDHEFQYVPLRSLDNYVVKNYNRIISYVKYDKYAEVKLIKSFLDHYNYCHIGSMILSMSKRIMNEVMSLAFNNDIDIFYQDTDSMHIYQNKLNLLAKLYKNEYNKDLVGGQLGQFHSDFELKGALAEVYSTKCIILGKKAYLDCLESIDKDGKTITGYHIRMKGVPRDSIERKAKELGGLEILYETLYNGDEIDFDLVSKARPKFMYDLHGYVSTRDQFIRKIKF